MIFKNWQTSVAGIGIAIAYAALAGIDKGLSLKDIVISCGFAVLGLLSKYFGTTGIGAKATTDPTKDATHPPTIAEVGGGTILKVE